MVGVDKLILHGLVVTIDGQDTVLEDGAVAVAGPRIAEVGSSAELLARHGRPGVETIDATGHLVLPGLINLHTHAADSLFRGLLDDLPLEPWLERLWVIEKRFVRPDTVRLGSRLGYAEMIRGGVTTALDQFFHSESLWPAAVEMGFRVATGPVYFDSGGRKTKTDAVRDVTHDQPSADRATSPPRSSYASSTARSRLNASRDPEPSDPECDPDVAHRCFGPLFDDDRRRRQLSLQECQRR